MSLFLVRVPDTYRVSPSNTSLFGDLIDFLSFEMAGVTSSAPEYFKLTIGAIGSPSRSPPLNKLPKLKIETLINLPNYKGKSKYQLHKTLLVFEALWNGYFHFLCSKKEKMSKSTFKTIFF